MSRDIPPDAEESLDRIAQSLELIAFHLAQLVDLKQPNETTITPGHVHVGDFKAPVHVEHIKGSW